MDVFIEMAEACLFLFLPIFAVSAYFTSVACRIAHQPGRRPAWYLVLISSLATVAVIILVGVLADLSVPGHPLKHPQFETDWQRIGKWIFPHAYSFFPALLPAFVVLILYRRKWKPC